MYVESHTLGASPTWKLLTRAVLELIQKLGFHVKSTKAAFYTLEIPLISASQYVASQRSNLRPAFRAGER